MCSPVRPALSARLVDGWLAPLVVVLTLAVFGTVLGLVGWNLRDRLRDQIVQREAELVYTAIAIQRQADEARLDLEADDPSVQLAMILEASSFESVVESFGGLIGLRLFDAQGELVTTVPLNVRDAALQGIEGLPLADGAPVGFYHPRARLADLFWTTEPELEAASQTPLLEILLPLMGGSEFGLTGVAQMFLDGHAAARQFHQLDAQLLRQALLAFGAGSVVIVGALGWAFHRLRRSNRLLATRTAGLLRANHELALAAKTSAIGAVTAHLIHGIKNPLAGLQHFIAHQANGNGDGRRRPEGGEEDWRDALETTRRIHALVNEVVRVLGEQSMTPAYELSLGELSDLVHGKCRELAASNGVTLKVCAEADESVDNRTANLVLLVLENLVRNAIEATPPGKAVTLTARHGADGLVWRVSDEGGGIPAAKQADLFAPSKSSKPGGTGIGLPICQLLSQHLGARLDLVSTSAKGTSFAFTLPRSGGDAEPVPADDRAAKPPELLNDRESPGGTSSASPHSENGFAASWNSALRRTGS